MTGLSNPGLLSCVPGPALLAPVPTVVWYFFPIALSDEDTGEEKSGISRLVGEKDMVLYRNCHEIR